MVVDPLPGHRRPEPRWRRLEPDERRRQILACAVRLFGERPYADVSTTDVAREAGVARGLVNHYFGTKRGLYVEAVRALVTVPAFRVDELAAGDLGTGDLGTGDLGTGGLEAGGLEAGGLEAGGLEARVDSGVAWFLDTVSRHSRPWLVAVSGGTAGQDPEVAAVLAEADEVSADALLQLVGAAPPPGPERDRIRAALRAWSGFAKATASEWVGRGDLDRGDAHLLLRTTLLTIIQDVFPQPPPPRRDHARLP